MRERRGERERERDRPRKKWGTEKNRGKETQKEGDRRAAQQGRVVGF